MNVDCILYGHPFSLIDGKGVSRNDCIEMYMKFGDSFIHQIDGKFFIQMKQDEKNYTAWSTLLPMFIDTKTSKILEHVYQKENPQMNKDFLISSIICPSYNLTGKRNTIRNKSIKKFELKYNGLVSSLTPIQDVELIPPFKKLIVKNGILVSCNDYLECVVLDESNITNRVNQIIMIMNQIIKDHNDICILQSAGIDSRIVYDLVRLQTKKFIKCTSDPQQQKDFVKTFLKSGDYRNHDLPYGKSLDERMKALKDSTILKSNGLSDLFYMFPEIYRPDCDLVLSGRSLLDKKIQKDYLFFYDKKFVVHINSNYYTYFNNYIDDKICHAMMMSPLEFKMFYSYMSGLNNSQIRNIITSKISENLGTKLENEKIGFISTCSTLNDGIGFSNVNIDASDEKIEVFFKETNTFLIGTLIFLGKMLKIKDYEIREFILNHESLFSLSSNINKEISDFLNNKFNCNSFDRILDFLRLVLN